jgi:hypothetical protein
MGSWPLLQIYYALCKLGLVCQELTVTSSDSFLILFGFNGQIVSTCCVVILVLGFVASDLSCDLIFPLGNSPVRGVWCRSECSFH